MGTASLKLMYVWPVMIIETHIGVHQGSHGKGLCADGDHLKHPRDCLTVFKSIFTTADD